MLVRGAISVLRRVGLVDAVEAWCKRPGKPQEG